MAETTNTQAGWVVTAKMPGDEEHEVATVRRGEGEHMARCSCEWLSPIFGLQSNAADAMFEHAGF